MTRGLIFRCLESQLCGLTGHDPRTLAIATLALAVWYAAGYIPVLRYLRAAESDRGLR